MSFWSRIFTPKPNTIGLVNKHEISDIIGFPTVRLLDRVYTPVTIESFTKYAKFNKVSGEKYIAETNDCDDFAFTFFTDARAWSPGIPVGVVLGNTTMGTAHAWNCFIDVQNKKMLFFDPQTDVLFQPTSENIWEIII